jgi:hypothetical protein
VPPITRAFTSFAPSNLFQGVRGPLGTGEASHLRRLRGIFAGQNAEGNRKGLG